MAEDWAGKGNREDLAPPVAELRDSAQRLGLVRKHKGRIVQTRRGRDLDADPMALWGHHAASMPLDREPAAQNAAVLALVHAAAGLPSRARTFDDIAVSLGIAGWRLRSGELDGWAAQHTDGATWRLLRLGPRGRRPLEPRDVRHGRTSAALRGTRSCAAEPRDNPSGTVAGPPHLGRAAGPPFDQSATRRPGTRSNSRRLMVRTASTI